MASESEDTVYQPKDAISQTITATMITAGAGLFAAAIRNTLTTRHLGALEAFRRVGGTTANFGSTPGE